MKTNINVHIENALTTIGIPTSVKGFSYLKEAIRIVAASKSPFTPAVKDVYPKIAKKFKTKSINVEKAVRTAIEACWNQQKPEKVNKILGEDYYSPREKPGNKEFITLCSYKVKAKVEKEKESDSKKEM